MKRTTVFAAIKMVIAVGVLALTAVVAAVGEITTVAVGFSHDDGPTTGASLDNPMAPTLDASGNLYIADLDDDPVPKVEGIAAPATRPGVSNPSSTATSTPVSPRSTPTPDAPIITTVARVAEKWGMPHRLAVDGLGNLYIAEGGSRVVRRVDAATGVMSTVAGNRSSGFSGDGGPATSASLSLIGGLAVDGAGNLYISDVRNKRIRKVHATRGVITTVAGTCGSSSNGGSFGDGSAATSASLNLPIGLTVDDAGNLYIADWEDARVRRVDGASGVITTVAGNGTPGFSGDGGPATSASLSNPTDVAIDGSGNLYITGRNYGRIRKVDAANGVITSVGGKETRGLAGDGGAATTTSPSFLFGSAVEVDGSGNLYIAGRHTVVRVEGVAAPAAMPGTGAFFAAPQRYGSGALRLWVIGTVAAGSVGLLGGGWIVYTRVRRGSRSGDRDRLRDALKKHAFWAGLAVVVLQLVPWAIAARSICGDEAGEPGYTLWWYVAIPLLGADILAAVALGLTGRARAATGVLVGFALLFVVIMGNLFALWLEGFYLYG